MSVTLQVIAYIAVVKALGPVNADVKAQKEREASYWERVTCLFDALGEHLEAPGSLILHFVVCKLHASILVRVDCTHTVLRDASIQPSGYTCDHCLKQNAAC